MRRPRRRLPCWPRSEGIASPEVQGGGHETRRVKAAAASGIISLSRLRSAATASFQTAKRAII